MLKIQEFYYRNDCGRPKDHCLRFPLLIIQSRYCPSDAIEVTGQLDFRKGDVGLPWRGPVAETPHRYCRARGLHPWSEKAQTLRPAAKKGSLSWTLGWAEDESKRPGKRLSERSGRSEEERLQL